MLMLKSATVALGITACLALTACGGGSVSASAESPSNAPATTASSSPDKGESGKDYESVAQQMNTAYPGEGWGDVPTTRKAVDNVCDALGSGMTRNQIARKLSDGSDPIQANALIGFATDEVCPQDG